MVKLDVKFKSDKYLEMKRVYACTYSSTSNLRSKCILVSKFKSIILGHVGLSVLFKIFVKICNIIICI
jgi:hypothetical protein